MNEKGREVILSGSLERVFAEAKERAALFGSSQLVYRPEPSKRELYAVMYKVFFEQISNSETLRSGAVAIFRETVVIVSPPSVSDRSDVCMKTT